MLTSIYAYITWTLNGFSLDGCLAYAHHSVRMFNTPTRLEANLDFFLKSHIKTTTKIFYKIYMNLEEIKSRIWVYQELAKDPS